MSGQWAPLSSNRHPFVTAGFQPFLYFFIFFWLLGSSTLSFLKVDTTSPPKSTPLPSRKPPSCTGAVAPDPGTGSKEASPEEPELRPGCPRCPRSPYPQWHLGRLGRSQSVSCRTSSGRRSPGPCPTVASDRSDRAKRTAISRHNLCSSIRSGWPGPIGWRPH